MLDYIYKNGLLYFKDENLLERSTLTTGWNRLFFYWFHLSRNPFFTLEHVNRVAYNVSCVIYNS